MNEVVQFLTELYESGYSYETINSARSALSALCELQDGYSVGTHPTICRFMSGVFNLRPTKPKYRETWDVSKVLSFLKTLSPVESISLKMLTFKLAMLIALTQASRAHSISLLTIDDMQKGEDTFTMYYSGLLKQSRRGRANPVVTFKEYSLDERLCVYRTLSEYLSKTGSLRGDEKRLFISFIKPHKVVVSTTISRWIKTVMRLSGINVDLYKSHSTRGASTSKANFSGVPLAEIMKVAGWSSAQTFAEYYNKPMEKDSSFESAVLQ